MDFLMILCWANDTFHWRKGQAGRLYSCGLKSRYSDCRCEAGIAGRGNLQDKIRIVEIATSLRSSRRQAQIAVCGR
jgi:hypothetical protein